MSVFSDSNGFFFATCYIFIFSESSDFNYQYFLLNCLGFLVGEKNMTKHFVLFAAAWVVKKEG